ncbi:hypothetical protein Taro_010091 [Colocasia esculenta]|uniref:Uncharacterized protein n=1 Tax=Colocasia esculenta TaxID=4460 RepID=A0A843U6M4_COLES|nr:hypothetical protein [Colocasia esculenta]
MSTRQRQRQQQQQQQQNKNKASSCSGGSRASNDRSCFAPVVLLIPRRFRRDRRQASVLTITNGACVNLKGVLTTLKLVLTYSQVREHMTRAINMSLSFMKRGGQKKRKYPKK